MKRNLLAMITLVGLIALYGCGSSVDPRVSEHGLTHVPDQLEIAGMFSEGMKSESFKTRRVNSSTKKIFPLLVN